MVPQQFAIGGNRLYLEFWAVTGVLRSPGYFTPTVAHEPSVECMVENVLSTRGGIGARMYLQALPRELVAILWG
jgi:hypothetical protein